jgi:hypothetical protein
VHRPERMNLQETSQREPLSGLPAEREQKPAAKRLLPGRWFFVGAIAILLVALFLRLGQISSESMGGDETYSVHVALSDTPLGFGLGDPDMQPPLFFLLLKAALPRHPVSELELRWLSVAAGAAMILLVLGLGWAAPQLRDATIFASLLLALNKEFIFYSQEVRPYALFTLLVGALLLWALLLERYEHSWPYWVAGTAALTAVLYTHFFACLYCAAVLVPVLLGRYSTRLKLKTLASAAAAGLLFLPCVLQKMQILLSKTVNLPPEATGAGLANWFTLKLLFADFIGVLDFPGATTLSFLVGAALFCCAVLPRLRNDSDSLNLRIRTTLALAAVLPPIVMFSIAVPPLHRSVFSERYVLPSIVPALVLISYGLWRVARRTPKPLAALALGGVILVALQALPVWSNWPGPMRQPTGAVARWLRYHDPNLPIYTTWPYGIGEPVTFYLNGQRPVYKLPGSPPMLINMQFYLDATAQEYRVPPPPALLPDRFIVIYRPGAAAENAVVQPLRSTFSATQEQCYSARGSQFGDCVLVLQKRAAVGIQ